MPRIWNGTTAILAATAAALGTQAVAQTVGVNAAVVNDVRMTTQANPRPHTAVVRERVALGNNIATGPRSVLQVLLLDRTNFTVGQNARIVVDRFVYDPDRQASAVGLSIGRGAFRFMSARSLHANPGASSLRTPVASIGIRGTIVEGAVGAEAVRMARREAAIPAGTRIDPQTATLILLRGPGPNTQGQDTPGAIDVTANGVTVTVTGSGFAVFIGGPGQAPIGPFLLSNHGSLQLSDWLGVPTRRLIQTIGPIERSPIDHNPVTDQFFQGEEIFAGRQTFPGNNTTVP